MIEDSFWWMAAGKSMNMKHRWGTKMNETVSLFMLSIWES